MVYGVWCTVYCFFPFLHVRQIVRVGTVPAFEMVIGMVANRMAVLYDLREDIGVLVDILPDHKKGRLDIILRKNSQHLRCHLRNRAVIEGEVGDFGSLSPAPL